MSRFLVWVLLSLGGLACVALGVGSLEGAAACSYFTALALTVHWVYAK